MRQGAQVNINASRVEADCWSLEHLYALLGFVALGAAAEHFRLNLKIMK
jgi:hypothetical protein